jgi:hypothetical protein
MRSQLAINLAKKLKMYGVEICEPPKYHICEGCEIRTAKPVFMEELKVVGHKLDCPVHFNPFDDRKELGQFVCIRHERFMKLELQRNAYNRNR